MNITSDSMSDEEDKDLENNDREVIKDFLKYSIAIQAHFETMEENNHKMRKIEHELKKEKKVD